MYGRGIVFLAVVVLQAVPGCLPIFPPADVQLTETDNGKTLIAEVGQKVVVTLASNASTGFYWLLAALDQTILEPTGQEYLEPVLDLPGAGGSERWEFTARAAGSTKLRLAYVGPGDPEGAEPAQSFEVVVVIREPGDTQTPAIDLQLTEQNSDGVAVVPVTGRMIVTLESNATTGYQWQLASLDQTVLENTEQTYISPTTDLVGAGGTERWVFVAQKAGETTLRMEYRRPWEPPETEPARTFSVTVTAYYAE